VIYVWTSCLIYCSRCIETHFLKPCHSVRLSRSLSRKLIMNAVRCKCKVNLYHWKLLTWRKHGSKTGTGTNRRSENLDGRDQNVHYRICKLNCRWKRQIAFSCSRKEQNDSYCLHKLSGSLQIGDPLSSRETINFYNIRTVHTGINSCSRFFLRNQ